MARDRAGGDSRHISQFPFSRTPDLISGESVGHSPSSGRLRGMDDLDISHDLWIPHSYPIRAVFREVVSIIGRLGWVSLRPVVWPGAGGNSGRPVYHDRGLCNCGRDRTLPCSACLIMESLGLCESLALRRWVNVVVDSCLSPHCVRTDDPVMGRRLVPGWRLLA